MHVADVFQSDSVTSRFLDISMLPEDRSRNLCVALCHGLPRITTLYIAVLWYELIHYKKTYLAKYHNRHNCYYGKNCGILVTASTIIQ